MLSLQTLGVSNYILLKIVAYTLHTNSRRCPEKKIFSSCIVFINIVIGFYILYVIFLSRH